MPLDQISPSQSLLIHSGRQAQLGDALSDIGRTLFGRTGAVACQGAAIAASDGTILGRTGQPVDQVETCSASDPVLCALGLDLVRIDETVCCDPNVTAIPALMLRIGLLGRILDLAHTHLKGRVSFGKKTLSHQLVKVGFSDAYGTMRLLSESAMQRDHTKNFAGLSDDHAELTKATLAAEKLMGGHGYLLHGTHPIGYLSTLLQAIYGPRS